MTIKHSITRRTALAGAAALPMLPAAAMAGTKPNATDAVWPEYVATQAAVDAFNAGHINVETDEEAYAILDPWNAAVDAVLAAPVVTLTDVERKLHVTVQNYGNEMPHNLVPDMLAQVRDATEGAV